VGYRIVVPAADPRRRGVTEPSLRAKRSNPSRYDKKEWIASSLRSSQ
jgi:hypothetical protein